MAAEADNVAGQVRGFSAGFSNLPALRQVGLMVGLAASVALAVAIVLWSWSPGYSLLFGGLSDKDSGQVMEALGQAGISYKVDQATGAIMVPSEQVHSARIKMATQGLPHSGGGGYELLDNDQGFGASRFQETTRYQRALEGELARSISAVDSIESARVHLAIPKQSSFVRNRDKPSASVLVNLYAGRTLDEARVAGIVHLVASSVPNLDTEQVTVVDQKGRLLTADQAVQGMVVNDKHLEYTRRLEEDYVKRIEDLLAPIVGLEGVKAQVAADLDFTVTERTSESFNPDAGAVRSEQTLEEQTTGNGTQGIPGALSNQPPPAGTTEAAAQGDETQTTPVNTTRRATRNYEVDRTVSHTRLATGIVRRLSVAVVVDDKEQANADGQAERVARDPEEMARITTLVREAVGFNAQRGDSVNVINAAFQPQADAVPAEAMPLWKEPWLMDVVSKVVGLLVVLLLVLFVLRPVLRGLAEKGAEGMAGGMQALPEGMTAGQLPMPEDHVSLGRQGHPEQLAPPVDKYSEQLERARSLVSDDPKRVAQVVKNWVGADG